MPVCGPLQRGVRRLIKTGCGARVRLVTTITAITTGVEAAASEMLASAAWSAVKALRDPVEAWRGDDPRTRRAPRAALGGDTPRAPTRTEIASGKDDHHEDDAHEHEVTGVEHHGPDSDSWRCCRGDVATDSRLTALALSGPAAAKG